MPGLFNDFNALNLFTYCINNPINRKDCDGYSSNPFYYLTHLLALNNYIEMFSKNGAVIVDKNYNNMGHIAIDFTTSYAGYSFGTFINAVDNYSSYIIFFSVALAMNTFINYYGRDFLFSPSCVIDEVIAHYKGYMWSIGKSYDCPIYMKLWGNAEHIKNNKNSAKSLVESACKQADIYEKDVRDNKKEALVFDYYNGIADCYKSTSKDPYYYPSKKKRKITVNTDWNDAWLKE